MKIAVLDYDVGNLASVQHGLARVGLEPLVTRKPKEVLAAKALVIPGVGAFAKGMENLEKFELLPVIKEAKEQKKPILGICLGMQLLFTESEEHGQTKGLGLLPGRVVRFPKGLKIPHMGWNTLSETKKHPLLFDVPPDSYVYFVHSYYVLGCPQNNIIASTDYGVRFPALVGEENIFGAQFHPEKSSRVGLKILSNFGELVKNGNHTGN